MRRRAAEVVSSETRAYIEILGTLERSGLAPMVMLCVLSDVIDAVKDAVRGAAS